VAPVIAGTIRRGGQGIRARVPPDHSGAPGVVPAAGLDPNEDERMRAPLRNLAFVAGPLILIASLVAWAAPAPGAPAEEIERNGVITGWWVGSDGKVAARLEGKTKEGQQYWLWFATPAKQTTTTHFEELFLRIIMEYRSEDQPARIPVTMVGNRANPEDGKDYRKPIPLIAISRP
jgi:hypothetical protein